MRARIKLVRVDSRLLHATVALNWNQFVNANYVVILDPDYVNDPFIEKVMQLCLPKSMKVKIVAPEQLTDFLADENLTRCNLMILFKDLDTAKKAVECGFYFSEIQIPYPASRIIIKKLSDFFSDKEINTIRYIQEKGIKFYFQTAPIDKKDYSVFKNKK